MKCPECGNYQPHVNGAHIEFCKKCGERLKTLPRTKARKVPENRKTIALGRTLNNRRNKEKLRMERAAALTEKDLQVVMREDLIIKRR
jgi:hypothetical protein